MSRNDQIAEVCNALAAGNRFLLLSHQNPDGDAIGSSLAFAAALAALGKEIEVVNIDGVPRNLSWLPLAEKVQMSVASDAAWDVAILLDCGTLSRTGIQNGFLSRAKTIVNVDHHPGNSLFGHANLVDPEACATAELVWEVLRAMPAPVGYSAAVAIYTAVLTDTGSFRFSNASAKAFEIASEMVARGADPSFVAQMVYDQQPIGRLRLLSRTLETLQMSPRDKVAAATVTQAMLRETHTSVEDLEGFVNHPRSIYGVEVGVLIREETVGRHRVTLRSKGRIDVSAIAQELGGGGHHNAAAATVEGSAQEIRQMIFAKVEGALDDEILKGRKVV